MTGDGLLSAVCTAWQGLVASSFASLAGDTNIWRRHLVVKCNVDLRIDFWAFCSGGRKCLVEENDNATFISACGRRQKPSQDLLHGSCRSGQDLDPGSRAEEGSNLNDPWSFHKVEP